MTSSAGVLPAPPSAKIVLAESENDLRLREALTQRSSSATLAIGPEGGWTDAERQLAIAAAWQPVSLGPLVLRAETADCAALAVVVNAWLS